MITDSTTLSYVTAMLSVVPYENLIIAKIDAGLIAP